MIRSKLGSFKELEKFLNIGIALSAEKDHNRLLEMILTEARRITNADAGTLYLREGNKLLFKIMQNETMNVFKGGNGEPIGLPPVQISKDNISSWVALTKQIVNIADVYEPQKNFDFSGPQKYDALTGYRTKSMLVIPLENHEGEVIGVLQLINARDDEGEVVPFADYYERVISSLASQAAVALTKMSLLEEINNLFHSFVQVMATAIDARTPYNVNHTRSIAALAEKLVGCINNVKEGSWAEVSFNPERTAQLVMAAWLHDIGKVAVPLNVMDKPTRLDQRLELIIQRFDLIAEQLRNRYLQSLVNAQEGNTRENNLPEEWWEEQQRKVKAAKALIIKADSPATFIDAGLLEQLKEIAACTYLDASGEVRPWLFPEELECLSVPKGTLTDGERKVMEGHVDIASRMLEKIRFTKHFKDVPKWAGMHHELLDGTGYPLGLKGEEIPREARILTLLDIYDALTASDRPYKKPLPPETALKILQSMAEEGKLDAELVAIFRESRIWKD